MYPSYIENNLSAGVYQLESFRLFCVFVFLSKRSSRTNYISKPRKTVTLQMFQFIVKVKTTN